MEENKSVHEITMNIFRKSIPIFQALSDCTRQQIILLLAENDELNVNEISDRLPLSRPAVSHHLKALKQAGIIDSNQKGTGNYYYLTLKESVELMKKLLKAIEENCNIR